MSIVQAVWYVYKSLLNSKSALAFQAIKAAQELQACIDPKTQILHVWGQEALIDASLRFGPEVPRYFTNSKEKRDGGKRVFLCTSLVVANIS